MDYREHRCSMCSFFTGCQKTLVDHLIRRHQSDSKFIVHCCGHACGASFRKLSSFKSHVARKHSRDPGYGTLAQDDLVSESGDGGGPSDSTCNHPISSSRLEGAYLLKLGAGHRLNQTALNEIIVGTKQLLTDKLEAVKNKLLNLSGSFDVPDFHYAFNCDLFEGLESAHKRERFFKDHFGLVVPKSVKLGTIVLRCKKFGFYRSSIKTAYGYYVPFIDQLTALLSMPEVQSVLGTKSNHSEFCVEVCEAFFAQQHHLQNSSSCLKFCIYTDEFEIVNPIGSHRKKHKITAFYWTLLNIPAEFRSRLSAIQLLALAKTCHVKKYLNSTEKLLHDFKSALALLKSGMVIEIAGGQPTVFNGYLMYALADTPAAQLLGGFKEGVGKANSPCRSCDIKRSEMASVATASRCSLRNLQEHEERVKFLHELNSKAKKYWSKQWGIVGPSVLGDVDGFEVTRCILQDPMHVILEGVAKSELQRMLKIFIVERKYFSLEFLNQKIRYFDYADCQMADKPEVIERKNLECNTVFPQTAGSMKVLLSNLPFMIADEIPADDEHWNTFLLLLQIMILCFTPVISADTPSVLECVVARHNTQFVSLYSESAFTPKMHYLLHLPDQMRWFGPLRHHSCMRFESKNGFFKLKRWFNFRNIPLSLSNYHQKWMCLQMTSSGGYRSAVYLYGGDEIEPSARVSGGARSVELLSDYLQRAGSNTVLSKEVIMSTPGVVINGIRYSVGTVLLAELYDTIKFLQIDEILIHDHMKYFVCSVLMVDYFDSHRNAFSVEISDEQCIICPGDLTCCWPQHRFRHFVMVQNADDCWTL